MDPKGPLPPTTMPSATDGSQTDDTHHPCLRHRRGRRRGPLVPLLLLILAAIGLFALRLPAVGDDLFEGWVAAALSSSPDGVGQKGGGGVVGRQLNPFPFPTLPARRRSVVECLQVQQPVLMPKANSGGDSASRVCSVVLMDHVFARSYGQPFVGNYSPPEIGRAHV